MGKKNKLPVSGMVSYKPTKADVERERAYRAEDAIRTLKRADEIKKDRELMKDCKAYVKEQSKTIVKL